MKNYIFIGTIDVEEIIEFVSDLTHYEWKEESIRQRIAKAHADTETIPILWDWDSLGRLKVANQRKHFSKFNSTEFSKILIEKLYNFYGDGEILRILITKLKIKKSIPPHEDGGKSLLIPRRVHIPIITNKDVIFSVNGEEKNMKVGEMWEIDNSKLHSVNNNSKKDRIHLIVDYHGAKDIKIPVK